MREAVNTSATSFVLIDPGPWIFGRRVLLPAGLIDRVHSEDQEQGADEAYLDEVGSYYAILGGARSVEV